MQAHLFICNKCGYSRRMAGEPSALMRGSTTPLVCKDCGHIYDHLDKNPDAKCPLCESTDLREWDYVNKPCPKCRPGTMELGYDGITMFLD